MTKAPTPPQSKSDHKDYSTFSKTNHSASKNRLSQKECSLQRIHFQVVFAVSLREGTVDGRNHAPVDR